jgi:hypothetical protein
MVGTRSRAIRRGMCISPKFQNLRNRPRPRPRCFGIRDRKETEVLQLICSVSLIAKTIGILEDEDDDEHEDDSSNLEFRLTECVLP